MIHVYRHNRKKPHTVPKYRERNERSKKEYEDEESSLPAIIPERRIYIPHVPNGINVL